MSRLIFAVALLTACSVAQSPPAEPAAPAAEADPAPSQSAQVDWDLFGQDFVDGKTLPLADAVARGPELLGQTVTVEGRVSEVCQKAGCWMVLSDDDLHVRIYMKDHAFSVDKGGAGRTGLVHGVLGQRQVDADEVAHYADETREGGVVPEKAAEGPTYEIVASAVRLARR